MRKQNFKGLIMKPVHFIVAGLIMIVAAALLGAYVPPENLEALGVLGTVGLITAIGGCVAAIVSYEDNQ